eukprot:GHUV01013756.1.p2 GENE.GHUV01013756.1~~GHUV01013756.1.p2  ORF type:complete len:284 (+),score=104.59 GHUV01013756.1:3353-4204(+)
MLRTVLQRLLQRQQAAINVPAGLQQQTTALAALIGSNSSACGSRPLSWCSREQQPPSITTPSMQQQDLQHSFAAAYSTHALVPEQQQQDQPQQTDPDKVPDNWRLFFFNNGVSKIRSRKPSIKRPKRHQWHYCSPDYDPMDDLPQQYLPPYAPPHAFQKDYRAIYFAEKPLHNRKHYRRMWQKNELIREQRWKQQWEARLAAMRKQSAKVQRMADRIIRQRAWEAYKADPEWYLHNLDELQQKAIEEKKERNRLKTERRLERKQQKQLAATAKKDQKSGGLFT